MTPLPEARSLAFTHDPLGRLVVTLPNGVQHAGVVPIRAFPFAAPQELIVLVDERGAELYSIPTLADLSEAARAVVEEELARREFLPIIMQIHSIAPATEPTSWHVTTNRGDLTFTLPSEDHVRRLPNHGAIVADVDGVRYRIPNTRALDARSRHLLTRYL